jgi:hypothetical protein
VTCRSFDHVPDFVIACRSVTLYVGVSAHVPAAQPDLGLATPSEIMTGWPTWTSEFVLALPPESLG